MPRNLGISMWLSTVQHASKEPLSMIIFGLGQTWLTHKLECYVDLEIDIICNFERLFHQFHVAKERQGYLRLVRWDKGDLDSKTSVYRMKVHVFGAAWSPGSSNFGLKNLAPHSHGKFREKSHQVQPAEDIHLVEGSRATCRSGNLRLHKFVSQENFTLTKHLEFSGALKQMYSNAW